MYRREIATRIEKHLLNLVNGFCRGRIADEVCCQLGGDEFCGCRMGGKILENCNALIHATLPVFAA